MARPLRIEFPGAVYHITSRGNARAPIFLVNPDRNLFLQILEETILRFEWSCHAYCLMDNHYHLLIETSQSTLSKGMRHLNGVYTQKFNRAHDRVGHIFQGRFKAILLEKDTHLLELSRYIVLNPVRAGMVSQVEEWLWSSYHKTVGNQTTPRFLKTDWLLSQFSGNHKKACSMYQQFVQEGYRKQSPWETLKGGHILGSKAFCEKVETEINEVSPEVPHGQRLFARPELKDLKNQELAPGMWMVLANRVHGYTLEEVAQFEGKHYSTVSKMIKKVEADSKIKT
ncbi:MAG: transposase [SAR324 cluster bacterium]|nr:transposase [SAR324 cluster bacterium]